MTTALNGFCHSRNCERTSHHSSWSAALNEIGKGGGIVQLKARKILIVTSNSEVSGTTQFSEYSDRLERITEIVISVKKT